MLVDEGHGIGTLGPGGRGALADFGIEDQVDVIIGPLDNALGSQGAFAACDELMARYLTGAARTFRFASALAPPAAAGALAALDLLESRPQLVDRLHENTWTLCEQLEREGFALALPPAPIVSLVFGDAAVAIRVAEAALARGVFAQAVVPPAVAPESVWPAPDADGLAPGRRAPAAARVLAQAVRDTGLEPAGAPPEPARVFDFEARAA